MPPGGAEQELAALREVQVRGLIMCAAAAQDILLCEQGSACY